MSAIAVLRTILMTKTGRLAKQAMLSWGGQRWSTPQLGPVNAEVGYTWGLGAIPLPVAGLRIGSKDKGVSVGFTGMGISTVPVIPGRSGSGQHNLWSWLASGGRPMEEIIQERFKTLDPDDPQAIEEALRDYGIDPNDPEIGVAALQKLRRTKERFKTLDPDDPQAIEEALRDCGIDPNDPEIGVAALQELRRTQETSRRGGSKLTAAGRA